MARLIIFAGLPGTGKSTIARSLAQHLRAVWLRIDSLEQAILSSAIQPSSVEDAGYRAGFAAAGDNLRIGLDVVADSVNPIELTRHAWRDVAKIASADPLDVEVVCSDMAEHRRRVQTRTVDVPGLKAPDWSAVVGRAYEPWRDDRLVIDTAACSASDAVDRIVARLSAM